MEAATGAASAVNNAAAKSVVSRPQQTLRQSVAVVGKGYWSGVENRVELRPSAAGSGIRFIREDLGGACVPVSLKNRVAATKRTNLRVGQVAVEMVEHLLSALSALGVDCCEVGLTAAELPGLDGSARAYVEAIDSVGVQPLSGSLIEPLVVQSPFTIAEDSSSSLVEVHPPTTDGLRVSYFVEYPGSSIWPQHYEVVVTPERYREDIAGARTFLLEEEARKLQESGVGLTVTTQDLVVFGPDGPLENELRWPNECARHKVLDVIGDLFLSGRPFHGDVTARRSGHRLNAEIVEKVLAAEAGTARVSGAS
ncbi:MAG: UDP-3-O-acyl-N-acetylglucosamine deacetylase [Planctomycetaceae bacterium]|nr:UDP-3-O-acyl-N-acetylglucosamine deacetylase [Planctomycetaceae bacterium]MBT4886307.1 UDP-3-O-acyl-N-acetylglucosamine deacetylase [Planctomycetaceae bacterium]MBT6458579.1 UDP-3-O-acyl-N-acetylglucosamine deacetylase [Planctomycetaceae bacterium]MBT6918349.1 UDP-3-O-acyl-N-acetylglucosamine deacetylase [Planctomycetaceae bacterium]MBT7727770.1 UDP-3-O-acyl-N-acetylglucosamine deacetylase [Planctomycetaceae bacterium]